MPEENELAICSFHALLHSAGKIMAPLLWILVPRPSSLLRVVNILSTGPFVVIPQ